MNANVFAAAPLPGFADPAQEAQQVFRAALDALARPGRVVAVPVTLPPLPPFEPAALALCLALADMDTPVWLDPLLRRPEIAAHLRFHVGCPLVEEPAAACFAVVADAQAMPPLAEFALGQDDYPDRSATVIVQVPALQGGGTAMLSGPGIPERVSVSPAGLPSEFWSWAAANHALFPRGVDMLFACDGELIGLPRSTRVEV